MKVKDILGLLPENQETQIHYKDFGHCSSYPLGFLNMDRILNANILKIETGWIESCRCTVFCIYTDIMNRSFQ